MEAQNSYEAGIRQTVENTRGLINEFEALGKRNVELVRELEMVMAEQRRLADQIQTEAQRALTAMATRREPADPHNAEVDAYSLVDTAARAARVKERLTIQARTLTGTGYVF